MKTTIPEWVVVEMSDILMSEFDYYIEEAHEHGLDVQVVFGVGRSPECLALVIEDVVTSTHHADGTVTRDPQEFRLIAYTGDEMTEVADRLEDAGYDDRAIRSAEMAYARATLVLAMHPVLRDCKWWQAQDDRDYNQFWLVDAPAVGGE